MGCSRGERFCIIFVLTFLWHLHCMRYAREFSKRVPPFWTSWSKRNNFVGCMFWLGYVVDPIYLCHTLVHLPFRRPISEASYCRISCWLSLGGGKGLDERKAVS